MRDEPGQDRSGATGDGGSRSQPPGGPSAGEPTEQIFHCDLCGNVMLNLHCKLICERCGYKRDCSDP